MANYISKIFGSSPVDPMQEHMETCYKAASELLKFFEHIVSGEQDKVDASRATIVQLEQKADELKKQIRSQLPKSLRFRSMLTRGR